MVEPTTIAAPAPRKKLLAMRWLEKQSMPSLLAQWNFGTWFWFHRLVPTADQMAPLFARCGLRATAVVHGMPPEALRNAYGAELVYATSKQLLADHLCDQIVLGGATDATRRRIHELRPGGAGLVRTRGWSTRPTA